MDVLRLVRNLVTNLAPPGGGLEAPPDEAERALQAFLGPAPIPGPGYTVDSIRDDAAMRGLEPELQVGIVHAVLDRALRPVTRWDAASNHWELFASRDSFMMMGHLLARKLPVDEAGLLLILERAARIAEGSPAANWQLPFPDHFPIGRIVALAERAAAETGLPPGAAAPLRRIRPSPTDEQRAELRKLAERIDALLGIACSPLPEPGEPWAEALRADLAAAAPEERAAWERLLAHARTAGGTQPIRANFATVEVQNSRFSGYARPET